MSSIPAIENLVEKLQSLPGIGSRSAERLVFHLLRLPNDSVHELAESIHEVNRKITSCEKCFNVADASLCFVCSDQMRDKEIYMVVEDPLDVLALEKTAQFRGLYHVLGGVIDPIRGIGADELRIHDLLGRLRQHFEESASAEIILATNPSTEGETTAAYIKKILEERFDSNLLKITRIARGLPVGGDLEYADPITLRRSLEGRSEY